MAFQLDAHNSCGFCRYVAREAYCAIIVENDLAMAFVNLRQYERGASLVIPRDHYETVLEIPEQALAAVHGLAKQLARAAAQAFGAVGANIYQNNGTKAGQSVPHLHAHVVPRYDKSNPEQLFLQRDFVAVSITEQEAIAAALRAAL